MAALKKALVALALLWAVPAAADPLDRWSAHIAEASSRFGVPEHWIRQVMRAESGGRTELRGRPIISRAGAMGLMQLMPRTWREMRAVLKLGPDPHDPRDNILAGAAYLRAMYDRFGYPGLYAAYNAGPARYAEHLSTGRRLPAETIVYVTNFAGGASGPSPRRSLAPPAPAGSLFAVLTVTGARRDDAAPETAAGSPDALFVRLPGPAPR